MDPGSQVSASRRPRLTASPARSQIPIAICNPCGMLMAGKPVTHTRILHMRIYSIRDVVIAVIAGGGVVLLAGILSIAPHRPTKPGVLLVGERSVSCLDSIVGPSGEITVTTMPDRQIITVKGDYLFIESVP